MRRALPWRCRGNRDGVGGVMKSDRPVIKCHLVPALTALQSIRKKGGRRQREREREGLKSRQTERWRKRGSRETGQGIWQRDRQALDEVRKG